MVGDMLLGRPSSQPSAWEAEQPLSACVGSGSRFALDWTRVPATFKASELTAEGFLGLLRKVKQQGEPLDEE